MVWRGLVVAQEVPDGAGGVRVLGEPGVAGAVDALLNPEIHTELRENARASIANKTWDALCRQLLDSYEEVLEDTRRVPLTIIGQRPELPRWAARALGARVA